jgi:hypothetical protein
MLASYCFWKALSQEFIVADIITHDKMRCSILAGDSPQKTADQIDILRICGYG